jgi:hypothetical protein
VRSISRHDAEQSDLGSKSLEAIVSIETDFQKSTRNAPKIAGHFPEVGVVNPIFTLALEHPHF